MFGHSPSNSGTLHKQPYQVNFKRIPFSSPAETFLKIHRKYDYAFLLESRGSKEKVAQFSFIGFNPETVIGVKDGNASFVSGCEKVEDPLDAVKRCLDKPHLSRAFRFVGGAVGYISYDAVRYWERLPEISVDDLRFPDVEMGVYDDGLIFDHVNREAYYFYTSSDRYDELRRVTKKPSEMDELSFTDQGVNIKREKYEKIVERAKEYISSGDIFQVVLSKRHTFNLSLIHISEPTRPY